MLAFIGILLFIVGFNFDYGSLVWIYASESFPTRLRTQGGSAMLTSDLFANFIVGVVFLNALGTLGGSLTFGIFMILALLSLIFIYRLAPKPRGASWSRSGGTGTTAVAGWRRRRSARKTAA